MLIASSATAQDSLYDAADDWFLGAGQLSLQVSEFFSRIGEQQRSFEQERGARELKSLGKYSMAVIGAELHIESLALAAKISNYIREGLLLTDQLLEETLIPRSANHDLFNKMNARTQQLYAHRSSLRAIADDEAEQVVELWRALAKAYGDIASLWIWK